MNTSETSPLKEILEYQHPDVISRFTDLFSISQDEACDIFTITKKFLFISQIKGVFIPDDLLIIDEMWHNFILFTSDYNDFCLNSFKRFLHHRPATKNEKEQNQQLKTTLPEEAKKLYLEKLQFLISVTYDYYGEETVIKWFELYPEKYNTKNILMLRKV